MQPHEAVSWWSAVKQSRVVCPASREARVISRHSDSAPPTDLTSDQWMLGACLKRSHTNLPVLVVACCHGNIPSLPAVEIANRLDLHSLPNPWQVTTHTSPHLTPHLTCSTQPSDTYWPFLVFAGSKFVNGLFA